MRILIFLLFFSFNALAQTDAALYTKLLKANVSTSGFVDYKSLSTKTKDIQFLLTNWSKVDVSKLSRNDALAFYINLYNLATINLIATNYPLKSIKDLYNGKPWDENFIQLGNKKVSLNHIENEIVRPKYKDARIHFALNCGATSCPPLLNVPFEGKTLDSQLNAQTKGFINNDKANTITATKIAISKIFDWYKVDFGDVKTFLLKYTSKPVGNQTISFTDYNWALNGK